MSAEGAPSALISSWLRKGTITLHGINTEIAYTVRILASSQNYKHLKLQKFKEVSRDGAFDYEQSKTTIPIDFFTF